jgi:hypothetical protein
MTNLIPWWMKLIAAAALAIAIGVAVHRVLEHFRQEGRDEIQAKWDADNAKRLKMTGVVLEAQAKTNKENDDAADRRKANLARDFSALEVRARSGSGGTCTRSAASARLLDDTVRAANADRPEAAPADGGGKASPDSVPVAAVTYDLIDDDTWKVKAGAAYRDAFDLWLACRKREDNDRNTIDRLTGGAP